MRSRLRERAPRFAAGADRAEFVDAPPSGGLAYRVVHEFDPRDLEGDHGRFSRGILDRAVALIGAVSQGGRHGQTGPHPSRAPVDPAP